MSLCKAVLDLKVWLACYCVDMRVSLCVQVYTQTVHAPAALHKQRHLVCTAGLSVYELSRCLSSAPGLAALAAKVPQTGVRLFHCFHASYCSLPDPSRPSKRDILVPANDKVNHLKYLSKTARRRGVAVRCGSTRSAGWGLYLFCDLAGRAGRATECGRSPQNCTALRLETRLRRLSCTYAIIQMQIAVPRKFGEAT